MKYRFITILHNMKLENIKNHGVMIFAGGKISNGVQILEETMKSKLMIYTAGSHSIDEYKGKVYFYIDSEFKEIKTVEQMDQVGTKYTFYFLREIQSFIHCLWEIKDNNVYVRDGFLIVYDKKIEDGCTYKASLSEVFSRSSLETDETMFYDKEIQLAINKFQILNLDDCQIDKVDYKFPTDDLFFKNRGSNRMIRAFYFTARARISFIFPMKILFYCTALECLFSTSSSEITYKISERVALMIGDTGENKKQLYKLIKKAYGIRSAIVHGSSLSGNSMELKDTSIALDNVLRDLISKNSEIFNKNDNELEDYYVGLLFNYDGNIKIENGEGIL